MRENVCKTLKYYDLILYHNLMNLPAYSLPEGYSFRFYQPGDEENWLEIEASAREFLCPEEGREAWQRYYGGKEEKLKSRMLFVMDAKGNPVATATAFDDQKDEAAGWLHWVAVRREHQGKGISKPLVYKALQILKEMGYPYACVPTQTTTWLAVKVYLDCGFIPWKGEAEGWRIIRTLTNHPKLQEYSLLTKQEIYDPVMLDMEKQVYTLFPDAVDFSIWTEGRLRAGIKTKAGTQYYSMMPKEEGGYLLGECIL